jgi:hypothetical protein
MTVLPFTPEQFFAVFAAYNLAIWPAQILAYLLGAAALALALRGGPVAQRIVPATLAAMWGWTGVGYHLLYFAAINPVARVFGAAFLVQGALFAWVALRGGGLSFGAQRSRLRLALGVFLAVYAAILYPFFGYLAGHVWPAVPSFGLAPCPVAIFTFGLLLVVQGRVPLWLLVIPALWALIGGQAAFLLSVPQDWMLLLGGVAATAVLIRDAWAGKTAPSRIG